MLRSVTVLHAVLIAAITLPVLSACGVRGVGDPCTPEAIPAGGFDPREVYVETSSVQCRTRTCMVFRLRGNPERVIGTDSCTGDPTGCVDPNAEIGLDNSLERVFCSCRCRATGDVNTPLCECGEGFHCVDVLTTGGVGVQGGYCVPTDLCTTDDDCDEGQLCNEGVCG